MRNHSTTATLKCIEKMESWENRCQNFYAKAAGDGYRIISGSPTYEIQTR